MDPRDGVVVPCNTPTWAVEIYHTLIGTSLPSGGYMSDAEPVLAWFLVQRVIEDTVSCVAFPLCDGMTWGADPDVTFVHAKSPQAARKKAHAWVKSYQETERVLA